MDWTGLMLRRNSVFRGGGWGVNRFEAGQTGMEVQGYGGFEGERDNLKFGII